MPQFNDTDTDKRLKQLRREEAEDLAKILSEKYGLPYVSLFTYPINIDSLRVISREDAEKNKLAVFDILNKKLSIGVLSPQNEDSMNRINEFTKKGFTVDVYMVSEESLKKVWDRYSELSLARKSTAGTVSISEENILQLREDIDAISDVEKIITDLVSSKEPNRLTRIMETILAGAMELGASDIHLEPAETTVRLRYRLDGILTDIVEFDAKTYSQVLSRVKLTSGMKVNIKGAQDGRFSIKISDVDIEIRSSIVPSTYDDSIVLRILDPKGISVELEDLGMHPRLLDVIKREINKPNGMLLNTGPTGSGKTTSLYAFLRSKYSPDIKILTIENPIEYHMKGIVQTQTDPKKNYTFAAGLKAALRQDPDVIMVGEIRDNETAAIAINAALTGHIVFSTLHTNNAAGAYPRLIDIGVNPKVLTSALTVAMAQRLVRKLCSNCKTEQDLSDEQRELVNHVAETIGDKTYLDGIQMEKHFTAPGCDQCHEGYKGRIGLYEAILSDEAVENVIVNNPSEREIWEAAKSQNILNMKQDALLKILSGTTSFEEVKRVIDIETDY